MAPRWEDWEDAVLRNIYKRADKNEATIVSALNGRRTWLSIIHRANRLGLVRNEAWEAWEDDIIKQMYPNQENSQQQILEALHHSRSWSAVQTRAGRLNLYRMLPWEEWEDEVLKRLYPLMEVCKEDILASLHNRRTWMAVQHRAQALELSASRGKRGRYDICHRYFRDITTSEQAYFLGVLAADGSVYQKRSRNRVTLAVQLRDRSWFEILAARLGPELRIVEGQTNDSRWVRFDIYSKNMVEDLSKFGVDEHKTKHFVWPYNLSDNLLPASILGYFDGDGSLCQTKCRTHVCWHWELVGTEKFLTHIKTYLEMHIPVKLNGPYRRHKLSSPHLYVIRTNRLRQIEIIDRFLNSSGLGLPRKHFPRGDSIAEP